MEEIQKIVVAGVVYNKGKFLVLKRSNTEDIFPNKWELPSGKVEFGEDPNKALIREIKEETGLIIENFFPLKCTHYIIEKPDKKRHTVQIIYMVNLLRINNIVLAEEHDDYKWITIDDLKELNTFDDMVEILNEASEKLK